MVDTLLERPSAIHPVVRGIIAGGGPVSAVEAFKGDYALQVYRAPRKRLWRGVDALLLPTTPTTYRVAEVLAEPFALNAQSRPLHQFREPAGHGRRRVPAGHPRNATGFGVSFIGPAWSEAPLLELAAAAIDRAHAPSLRRSIWRASDRGETGGRRRASGRHATALATDIARCAVRARVPDRGGLQALRHGGDLAAQASSGLCRRGRRGDRGRGL